MLLKIYTQLHFNCLLKNKLNKKIVKETKIIFEYKFKLTKLNKIEYSFST